MADSRLFWPTAEQERQRQNLMDQMMRVRGVDPAAASRVDGGLALLEAVCKCRMCPDEGACSHWLAGDAETTPEDFCPNAGFFSSLTKLD